MIKKLLLLFICLFLCSVALKSVACATENPIHFLEQKDVRHRTLKTFITQSMSHHFTMKGSEASFVLDYGGNNPNPTIYEMKGFTMKPTVRSPSAADKMNGIDLKFSIIVSSKVYREGKMGTHQFSDWKDGTPGPANSMMSWFNFQRRDGLFEYKPAMMAKYCRSRGNFQMKKFR